MEALRKKLDSLGMSFGIFVANPGGWNRSGVADAKQHEAFLEEGQSLSHTGNWSFTVNDAVSRWSREMYRVMGLDLGTPEPSLDVVWTMIHREDRARLRGWPLRRGSPGSDW